MARGSRSSTRRRENPGPRSMSAKTARAPPPPVSGARGGNANIASVIVMLMMAHAAAAGTAFNHTLTFVATDAEEFGMLGANHYGAKRAADGTMKNIRDVANFASLTSGTQL